MNEMKKFTEEYLNTDIRESNLAAMTAYNLSRAGLNIFGKVLDAEQEDLLRIKDMGPRSVLHIIDFYKAHDCMDSADKLQQYIDRRIQEIGSETESSQS